jgi:hypothetical protein
MPQCHPPKSTESPFQGTQWGEQLHQGIIAQLERAVVVLNQIREKMEDFPEEGKPVKKTKKPNQNKKTQRIS